MILDLLWFILIGILVGWLAGKIFKGSGNGLIINLLVGIAGSWLGSFLFGKWLDGGFWGFVGSVLGAIILLWIISLIRGKK